MNTEKMYDDIEKHGYHVHCVFDIKKKLKNGEMVEIMNIHTHGITETWKHPELQIIIPLHQSVIEGILQNIVSKIKIGEKLVEGLFYDDIIGNFPVKFLKKPEGMRLILPDEAGKFEDSESPVFQAQFELENID
jgi:hypothetical protein